MPRSDFGPEVQSAIEDANAAAGNQTGQRQNRPQSPGQIVNREERPDVMRGRTADAGVQTRVPRPVVQADTGTPRAAAAPDARALGSLPHIAAATSIAHAILGNRGIR